MSEPNPTYGKKMSDYSERLKRVNKAMRLLSKVRIGLPNKVEFVYDIGKVLCYPKVRKWVIILKGSEREPIVRYIPIGRRIDVTKHKARLYLKLAATKLI